MLSIPVTSTLSLMFRSSSLYPDHSSPATLITTLVLFNFFKTTPFCPISLSAVAFLPDFFVTFLANFLVDKIKINEETANPIN